MCAYVHMYLIILWIFTININTNTFGIRMSVWACHSFRLLLQCGMFFFFFCSLHNICCQNVCCHSYVPWLSNVLCRHYPVKDLRTFHSQPVRVNAGPRTVAVRTVLVFAWHWPLQGCRAVFIPCKYK